MKTALHFKVLFVLLITPALLFANEKGQWKGKYTKEKTYHKEFNVNANATLKVDNSYGNVDITTWDENRVVIDVTVSTNGNNENKVQNKLDGIDVIFSGSSNEVSAKTKFAKSNSWFNWGNSRVSMKVNYIIKMPITNNVDLENDYGSINLDKLEGHAKIDCDYGKITAKELMSNNNYINFDYTNNSYFEYINAGIINADYSSYTVGKTNDLTITADFSKSHVEMAEDINYNCDYGSITLDNVNNVSGDGDNVTTRFGNVYRSVSLKADYGSFKLDNLSATAGDVNIDSDYMKITIGYDPAYNFNFDLDLKNASLRDGDDLEIIKRRERSSEKYYAGFYGNSNSTNKIKINSSYGSVTLKKN
jgi:hypothetical protein